MTRAGVVAPVFLHATIAFATIAVVVVTLVELTSRQVAIGDEGVPLVIAQPLAEGHLGAVLRRALSTRSPAAVVPATPSATRLPDRSFETPGRHPDAALVVVAWSTSHFQEPFVSAGNACNSIASAETSVL